MQNRCAPKRRPKSRPRKASERKTEKKTEKKNEGNVIARFFDHFAAQVTKWAGSPVAFGIALIAVIIWGLSGPAFGYSETWQLVINTGTTIITFLMVFLIQQSQNKDSEALHLKLDELLIAVEGADEGLVDAERLDEDKLLALAAACTARARKQHRQRARSRRSNRH
nr:low affinity iron permease family protein [Achromobacter sp.]